MEKQEIKEKLLGKKIKDEDRIFTIVKINWNPKFKQFRLTDESDRHYWIEKQYIETLIEKGTVAIPVYLVEKPWVLTLTS